MPIGFEADNADLVWRQAAVALMSADHSTLQQSRLGDTREILHAYLTIRNPRNRWVYSRKPGINPAFAIAEAFWILSGSNKASDINFWNPALPRYAGRAENYHGAYGFRLRNQFGFDQIERAYAALHSNPNSRQVVMQIWSSVEDFPDEDGGPVSADIPCNICSMLKVRSGRLEWTQVMRSNDLFRGTPYNFVQFTMLQEVLAGWLGYEMGGYLQICDSMHLYEDDLKHFSVHNDTLIPANPDSLSLPKKESDEVLEEMICRLGQFAAHELEENSFRKILEVSSLPKAYRNLLCIAAADSARRRGWIEAMEESAAACQNDALRQVWDGWVLNKSNRQ